MKLLTIYSIVALQLIALGCTKTKSMSGSASLTIVNAVPNSNPVITNFDPVSAKGNAEGSLHYFATATQISYAGSWESGSYTGLTSLSLSQISDTMVSIWSGTLTLPVGSVHTLFLAGDTSAVDTLFTTDVIPYYPATDSVTGIRFVNLSTGSSPISINLEGNPNGSEVASLNYKGITTFKPYLNNSTTQDYLFVIRDAVTGDSLTQFDFAQVGSYNNGNGLTDPNNGNLLTFKSITIALIGQPGVNAVVPQSTIQIDDY
jgi:hypothetical protein